MANNNENKILNVPNLRFPEFTEEWKAERLNDIAKLTKGVGISKDQLSESGEPCILYGELYTKYKSEIIKEIISKTDIPTEKLMRSKANDVIIPCSGETAIDIATARCVLLDNVLLGGDLNIIRLPHHDGSFMSYQLNGKRKYNIAKVAQGVSVVHLYGDHLKEVLTYNPKLEEQKKIVRLLALLDERIATQSKIIEDLKKLKSAITDLLFRSITEAHTIRLGDIAHITNGVGDVQDANTEHKKDWYPFFDRSEELKWFPTYSFDKEAIIYAGEGQSFYPRYYNGKFALHQRCYAITDFASCILPKYCYHFMNTLNSYFVRNSVGSTVPSLRMDIFQKAEIKLPPISKQQHICKIIDVLCSKLEVEQSVISSIQELKQFLLSQMFI
ncbi:restriction endonuclease subunit S [Bacteroides salyersiae]|uniref:restriction endonuclease subunit S n=1 Tax=Bacteroides salyersiae TaxID=291644 RepID=UPI001D09311E|nr:restriction endonuclease subunit S [Bacteroides salyersiae]MCB6649367.1 restriction endonuclease subunit S [Bacteroides salyersiae]